MARRDLLWVLVLILACGLLEVWASWLSIGAVSGFPKLGSMTTGWILPVTTEAYWSAALYAWLAKPAGSRSASFAKWSAAAMFALSLAGQESDHLLAAAGRAAPPVVVVGFVTALPLISIALIAILIHLRQKDRAEALKAAEDDRRAEAEARRAAAEASRVAELEEALSNAHDAHGETRTELETVRAALAAAEAKIEGLARKLAAKSPKPSASKPPAASRVIPQAEREQRIRELFAADPSISIKAAADALGWSRDTVSPILKALQDEANVRPMERRQA